MTFNLLKMQDLLIELMDGHVTYLMDGNRGKADPLTKRPSSISKLDCSGFVQYVVYNSTIQNHRLPAGSVKQRDWLDGRYPKVPYADAGKSDGKLRIAFRDPIRDRKTKKRKEPGHVWLIVNRWTLESTKRCGEDGPTSLLYTMRSHEANRCFLLGSLNPKPSNGGQWIPKVAKWTAFGGRECSD